MSFGEIGPDFDGPAVGGQGLVGPVLVLEDVAQVVEKVGVFAHGFQGFAETRLGFLGLALFVEDDAEAVAGQRKIGPKR